MTLTELFQQSCEQYARRPAFSNLGCTVTYSQLAEQSRSFAAYLQNQFKIKKGDRIALMLPNILQYPICFFGALLAGLTIVNVNPMYTARELADQLCDSGAETIVVLANFAHILQHAVPATGVKNVVITEIGDLCGFFKSRLINFIINKIKKKVPERNILYSVAFKEVIRQGRKQHFQEVKITGEDLALLQYTGGTTGISKGAMISHHNLAANVEQILAWIGGKLQPGKEVSIIALPLYHIFSLTVCCCAFTKLGAHGILITNPRDLSKTAKIISKYKITVFIGINSLLNALLNTADFKKLDFSSLKLTIAGGMAVQSAVAEKWHAITGCVVTEGYGLTEASPVVTINPLGQKEFINSIGLPLPSTEVSIRNENGEELAIGEEGELCVKGPQVMLGYWQKEAETRNVFWENGWLRTGDIGVKDERGFLYIVDRKKDMIVTNGYNVYPNEIEEVIMAHPAVLEVAVVGIPSKHAGEVVKAFIVRKEEYLTREKLVVFCKDRLTGYKVPKRVEFRDKLPKSNVGKILRRALRGEV